MSHLSLSLLGAFQATINDEPFSFSSNKARALLAYLAVESSRPHRREILVTLLWPERPEHVARNNLRYTLSTLRKSIGDRSEKNPVSQSIPVLKVSRETIEFNCNADCSLDVTHFSDLLKDINHTTSTQTLITAVNLYQGHFLEGFSIRDSVNFDDWIMLTRDRLHRRVSLALKQLISIFIQEGRYESACRYAWRLVETDPWQESSYQLLMRTLDLNGDRTSALAQFEVCKKILQTEFNVEPSETTLQLFEMIRAGKLLPSSVPIGQKTVEESTKSNENDYTYISPPNREIEKAVFVARTTELHQLEAQLQNAFKGKGRVIFVVGEAGQGKTMLMQEFAKQMQKKYPSVVLTGGNCNAYTGLGDPYLPFREILESLALASYKDNTSATPLPDSRREYDLYRTTARAIFEKGQDLINVFISGPVCIQTHLPQSTKNSSWYKNLIDLVDKKNKVSPTGKLQQDDLFQQYTSVLSVISKEHPLILLIDDMQWADLGSISLLFHLGRRLEGSRILVLGAYRPEEVALGRKGERHPIAPLLSEFKRYWGDIEINLQNTDAEKYIQEYLDSEPNKLDQSFRHTLLHQTRGHPLFTVELLRGMQERGDLRQDIDRHWIEGPQLNWDILPARIEAVIAERINRLAESQIQSLRIASVEGELFIAEVISQIQKLNTNVVISSLSGELSRKHRLVRALRINQATQKQLSQYRFRHILFQKYIYNSMDEIERSHLHNVVAEALVGLYDGKLHTIAPQLGWHFEQAGKIKEAAKYYHRAGQQAVRMSANSEAILHLNKAISLIHKLPDSLERDEWELSLQFEITVPITAYRSWGAPEALHAYSCAMELSQRLENTPKLVQAMYLKQSAYTTQCEHHSALEVAEEVYKLTENSTDLLLRLLGHQMLCVTNMFCGHFSRSLHHGQQLLKLYDVEKHRHLAYELMQDPATISMIFMLYDLWYLGYPDRAVELSQEAVALADIIKHPFTDFFRLTFQTRLHRWRREIDKTQASAEMLMDTWKEYKNPMAKACSMVEQAWVLSQLGHNPEAIEMLEDAIIMWKETGMLIHDPEFFGILAEMYAQTGRCAYGLELIDKAIASMEKGHEWYHEAEIYRICGNLLLMQDRDNTTEAEIAFARSIKAAQRMGAKSCELRTAMSLVRMWQAQDNHNKLQDAYAHISEVYNWFTEGFDTRDLQEAKELLENIK